MDRRQRCVLPYSKGHAVSRPAQFSFNAFTKRRLQHNHESYADFFLMCFSH